MISLRAETLKVLEASPVILRRLTVDLDETLLRARPEAGEWAVIEVVAHMADVDERALERVRRILTEDNPALPWFDHEALVDQRNYLSLPITGELARHTSSRRELVDLLAGLPTQAWDRTGRVADHGEVTLMEYAVHVAAEDIDHLAQIVRAQRDASRLL